MARPRLNPGTAPDAPGGLMKRSDGITSSPANTDPRPASIRRAQPLTDDQVLEAGLAIQRNGEEPSIRKLCANLHASPNTISPILNRLRLRGLLSEYTYPQTIQGRSLSLRGDQLALLMDWAFSAQRQARCADVDLPPLPWPFGDPTEGTCIEVDDV